MRPFWKAVLLSACIAITAQARSFGRAAVPLLPEETGVRKGASVAKSEESTEHGRSKIFYGVGAEAGALMIPSNANSGALGLQWMFGARATARLRVAPKFYVVPSLGYFTRGDGIAAVSVTQNLIEAGVTGFWSPNPHKNSIFLVGAAYRFDVILSTIRALGYSQTATAFRSRVGPAAQFSTKINQHFVGLVNVEATTPLTTPLSIFPAVHLGVLFKL